MDANTMAAPNREYLEFAFVRQTATGAGKNQNLIMEARDDGTFVVKEGRVGIKVGRSKPTFRGQYPMEEWDDYYLNRLERGYIVTKTKKMEAKEVKHSGDSLNGETYKPLEDKSVSRIIQRLVSFVTDLISTNYTVKVEDISDEMLELGKNTLVELSAQYKALSVAEFNSKLSVLFAAVPRRMDKVSKYLAKRPEDFEKIIESETELYEVIYAQVRGEDESPNQPEQTILEAKGLEWREVNDEEKEWILKKLDGDASRYVNAWKITNKKTEDRFNAFVERNDLKKDGVSHLFHGSRNENFWSIITNGLTINPIGVVICGKAYGQGTYFAPAACKSLGYTSRSGSKWANGTQNTGLLGIYKVATGSKQQRYNGSHGCDSSITWKKLQNIQPGAFCTWAESRWSGFMMDEVIVYQDAQSTIEYLVEVGL